MKMFFIGLRRGIKSFGDGIAVIVNSVLLLVVYIIGVGLTSIIAKASGKRFLDMKTNNEKTYWSDLDLKTKSREEYYRQF